jgi:hypothetical protein
MIDELKLGLGKFKSRGMGIFFKWRLLSQQVFRGDNAVLTIRRPHVCVSKFYDDGNLNRCLIHAAQHVSLVYNILNLSTPTI